MLPEVNDNLLCFVDIEGDIIVAAPVHQILSLIPVLCVVIVRDPTHYGGVVSKLENQIGGEFGHTVSVNSVMNGTLCLYSAQETILFTV